MADLLLFAWHAADHCMIQLASTIAAAYAEQRQLEGQHDASHHVSH